MRQDITKITTAPNISAIQTDPTIKKTHLLPDTNKPMVYAPVQIHVEKTGGLVLAVVIFLALAACTVVNVGVLMVHQIIVVK